MPLPTSSVKRTTDSAYVGLPSSTIRRCISDTSMNMNPRPIGEEEDEEGRGAQVSSRLEARPERERRQMHAAVSTVITTSEHGEEPNGLEIRAVRIEPVDVERDFMTSRNRSI